MAAFHLLLVGSAVLVATTLGTTPGKVEKRRRHDYSYAVRDESTPPSAVYTTSWAVEITQGGEKMADYIARRYGFHNLGKVKGLIAYANRYQHS